MAAEFHGLGRLEVEDILEALADSLEALATLGWVSAFLLALLWCLTSRSRPETYTPECLADVDDDAHDLVVRLVLQHLANGGKHDVQPCLVVGLAALECVGPTTTVLVLRILPLWTNALLE